MQKLLALELPGGTTIGENDKTNIFVGGKGWKLGINSEGGALTLADIVNTIVPLIFVIAGITLFIMLIAGGLTIFTSAGNPEKMKQGQGRIVSALVGLIIIFAAYWIVQLVEYSLGLSLLGT